MHLTAILDVAKPIVRRIVSSALHGPAGIEDTEDVVSDTLTHSHWPPMLPLSRKVCEGRRFEGPQQFRRRDAERGLAVIPPSSETHPEQFSGEPSPSTFCA